MPLPTNKKAREKSTEKLDDIRRNIAPVNSKPPSIGFDDELTLRMGRTALDGCCAGITSNVLQTSYILEAFGKLCGAELYTFLLDKSRAVQQAQGERTYHIFNQLCAGAPSGLRGCFQHLFRLTGLKLKRACDYNYLNQSGCLEIHDVDDAHKFQILTGALNIVGISKEDQEHAFDMISAVLWLGNISFYVFRHLKIT